MAERTPRETISLTRRAALGVAATGLLSLAGAKKAPAAGGYRPGSQALAELNLALDTIQRAAQKEDGEPVCGRAGAIVHIAAFDAANSAAPKFAPYLVTERAPTGVRAEVAALAAGYAALAALYPKRAAQIPELRAKALGSDGDGASVEWGEKVSKAVLESRRGDRYADAIAPANGEEKTGVWRPNPAGADGKRPPGLLPQLAVTTPFAAPRPDYFRPDPPPPLTSGAYYADWEEARRIGAKDSKERTAEQTEIATFHSDGGEHHWNRIARQFVRREADLVETARLFALLNIALADAGIFSFDAKYFYNYWRPIHAIRFAAEDGNPDTAPDPNWEPLLKTPNHPDYVSRHCAVARAGTGILVAHFGDARSFEGTSDALPGKKRRFRSISQVADETCDARVFGGIHSRIADVQGDLGGRRIVAYVLAKSLRPLG